jgi:hypothetical protein
MDKCRSVYSTHIGAAQLLDTLRFSVTFQDHVWSLLNVSLYHSVVLLVNIYPFSSPGGRQTSRVLITFGTQQGTICRIDVRIRPSSRSRR